MYNEEVEKWLKDHNKTVMNYEDFVGFIWEKTNNRPKEWREGQGIFNYIDMYFGETARTVQFTEGIDCFYDNEQIQPFIDACWTYFVRSYNPLEIGG